MRAILDDRGLQVSWEAKPDALDVERRPAWWSASQLLRGTA
jgi:hypothetical protein